MARVTPKIPKGNYVLLNTPNPKGEKCIYLRFYVDGKYIKRSTDIWILEKDWDSTKQVVKSSNINAGRINHLLAINYERIQAALFSIQGSITYDVINSILGRSRKKDDEPQETNTGKANAIDLIEYAHKYNDMMYKQEKYGYTSWYNKKKNIEAFETFILHYKRCDRPTFDTLTPMLFDEYVQYRFEVKKNTSKEGINKTLVPLYAALQYAELNGEIDKGTIAPIVSRYLIVRPTKYNAATSSEKKIKYLTPEQMEYLHEYCKKSKSQNVRNVFDMFFFSFYACGMRCSDIITLEWSQIDMESRTIRKIQVKTKKEPNVEIPLSDQAMEILQRWKNYGLNKRFVFNRLPEDFDMANERQLFMARNAKDKGLNRVLATISRNAKLPFQITMHVARHSFAVMAINRGVSLHMVSKLMGHASLLATEKTYAEFLKEKVKDDMDRILSFKAEK